MQNTSLPSFMSAQPSMEQFSNPPEIRLLAAVVSLALRDLTRKPIRIHQNNNKMRLHPEALSACRFIFTTHSDGYLEMLDIDPPMFRKNVIEIMHDLQEKKIGEFDASSRRIMKVNHSLWNELYLEYGDLLHVPLPEEDDDYFE